MSRRIPTRKTHCTYNSNLENCPKKYLRFLFLQMGLFLETGFWWLKGNVWAQVPQITITFLHLVKFGHIFVPIVKDCLTTSQKLVFSVQGQTIKQKLKRVFTIRFTATETRVSHIGKLSADRGNVPANHGFVRCRMLRESNPACQIASPASGPMH